MPCSNPHSILLVEDNQSVQGLFADCLRLEGFHVLTANSVDAAIQVCKQYPDSLDLLIADVLLPRSSGFQLSQSDRAKPSLASGVALAQQVRFKRPEVRVLYISGHGDHELRRLGVFREPWPLLRKPLNPYMLVQTVRQLLTTNYPPWTQ